MHSRSRRQSLAKVKEERFFAMRRFAIVASGRSQITYALFFKYCLAPKAAEIKAEVEAKVEEAIKPPPQEPPELEFMAPLPSVSAQDL
jgi:hypothetical protein